MREIDRNLLYMRRKRRRTRKASAKRIAAFLTRLSKILAFTKKSAKLMALQTENL